MSWETVSAVTCDICHQSVVTRPQETAPPDDWAEIVVPLDRTMTPVKKHLCAHCLENIWVENQICLSGTSAFVVLGNETVDVGLEGKRILRIDSLKRVSLRDQRSDPADGEEEVNNAD